MATRDIVPNNNNEGNLGTTLKRWLKGWFADIFVSGNITDGVNSVTVADLVGSFTADNSNSTSGVFDGAVLSINATTSLFDISAGTGQIVDPATIPVPIPTPITISSAVGVAITTIGNDFTFVLITNAGAVLQQSTSPTPQQLRTHILLGKINHANHTTISSVINQPTLAIGVSSGLEDLMRDGIGMINATPVLPSPATLLNISTNVGVLWKIGSNYNIDKNNPHQKAFNAYDSSVTAFPYLLSDGSIDTPLTNDVRPAIYESATGVTSAVPALKWSNQRVYITITGSLLMMYGQTTYNSEALALEFLGGENHLLPPVLTSGDAILIGIITLAENTTDLNTADALFQNASKFGEFAKGGVSVTATTLQGAYNNSTPLAEILTDVTNGSLTVRNGTALADTLFVYEGKNEAGTTTFSVDGNGDVVATNYNGVPLTALGSTTLFLNESGAYSTPSGGGGGTSPSLRNATATDTFATASETINCTSNTFTVNLPTATGIQGTVYTLVNSGTGVITFDANGTETINGSLTIDIKKQYVSRTVQSDGTNWIII